MDLAHETLDLLGTPVRRQLFTPRYNHHVAPAEGRSLEAWMAWHLVGRGEGWAETPRIELRAGETPEIIVTPDRPEAVERVEILYALNNPLPMSRFWRGAEGAARDGAIWRGRAPFHAAGDVIYTFANVAYREGYTLSSRLLRRAARELAEARPSLEAERLIDRMEDTSGWYYVPAYTDPNRETVYFQPWKGAAGEKGFTLHPAAFGEVVNFHFATHKPGDPQWRRRGTGAIALDLLAERAPEKLVLRASERHFGRGWKDYDATPELPAAASGWVALRLDAARFQSTQGEPLAAWDEVDCIAIIGSAPASRTPVFRGLRWEE
jgi:hypothetical protein